MIYPRMVSFTVTFACNLRCRMCGQWGETGWFKNSRPPQSLPVGFWLGLLDQMKKMGTGALLLRGGEPLLYPGLAKIIARASELGMFTALDTNGILLGVQASELLDAGLSHITLSVDGPQETHDALRGVPGTFEKVRQSVEGFHAEEARRGRASILKTLHCTLTPLNYHTMPQLPDAARQLGLTAFSTAPEYSVSINDMKAHEQVFKAAFGVRPCCSPGFVRTELMDSELLLKYRGEMLRNMGGIAYEPYMNFSEQEYRDWLDHAEVSAGPCRLPGLMMDVEPDGRVNLCIDLADFSPGNAREESLAELFNKPQSDRFRRMALDQTLPACRRCGTRYMAQFMQ